MNLQGLGAPQYQRHAAGGPWRPLEEYAAWRPATSFAELRGSLAFLADTTAFEDPEPILELLKAMRVPAVGTQETTEDCFDRLHDMPLVLLEDELLWPLCDRLFSPEGSESLARLPQPLLHEVLVALLLVCPMDAWVQDIAESSATASFLPLDAVYVCAMRRYAATRISGGHLATAEHFMERALPLVLDCAFGAGALRLPVDVHLSICAALSFMAAASSDVLNRIASHAAGFDVLLSLSITDWRSASSFLLPHVEQCWQDARSALLLRKRAGSCLSEDHVPTEVFTHIMAFLMDSEAPATCWALLRRSSCEAAADRARRSDAVVFDAEATLFRAENTASAGASLPEDYFFLHLLTLMMLDHKDLYRRFREQCQGLQALFALCAAKGEGGRGYGPFVTNFLGSLLLVDPECLLASPPPGCVLAALLERGLRGAEAAAPLKPPQADESQAQDALAAAEVQLEPEKRAPIGAAGAEWGDAVDAFARLKRATLARAIWAEAVEPGPLKDPPLAPRQVLTPVGDLSLLQLARLAGLGCSFYLLGDAPKRLHRFCPEVFPEEEDDEQPRVWTPMTHPGKGVNSILRSNNCGIL